MVPRTDETGAEIPGEMEEFHPDANNIRVQVTFNNSQLSNELGAESAADVGVVHMPLKDKVFADEEVNATADVEKLDANDIIVDTLQVAEKDVNLDGATDTVTFVTDGFSVYAFTVDFHYEDEQGEAHDYSIPGNSQILLSDLIEALNIKNGDALLNVQDVASVAFTDAHLVTVEQVSGLITYNDAENVDVGEKDFLLTSLEPFGSDEVLTIALTNGGEIVVGVTDNQDYYVKVIFLDKNGNEQADGQITIDDEWKIIVNAWGSKLSDAVTAQNNKVYSISVDDGAYAGAEVTGIQYPGQWSAQTAGDGGTVGNYIISINNNYDGGDANASVTFSPQPTYTVAVTYKDSTGENVITNPAISSGYHILAKDSGNNKKYYGVIGTNGSLTWYNSSNSVVTELGAVGSFELRHYTNGQVDYNTCDQGDVVTGTDTFDFTLTTTPDDNGVYQFTAVKKPVYEVKLVFADDENPSGIGSGYSIYVSKKAMDANNNDGDPVTYYASQEVTLDGTPSQTIPFTVFNRSNANPGSYSYASDDTLTVYLVKDLAVEQNEKPRGNISGGTIVKSGDAVGSYSVAITSEADRTTFTFTTIEPYKYAIKSADGQAISFDDSYNGNWYLLSTLTKASGGTYYYVTPVSLQGQTAVPATGTNEITRFYTADGNNLSGLTIGQESSNTNATSSVYQTGDTVENSLVFTGTNNAQNYKQILKGFDNATLTHDVYKDGHVVNKYILSDVTTGGVGTITLTPVPDFKVKTEFFEADRETHATPLPTDYKLLIKMIRDGETYYALHTVDTSANPSGASATVKFYRYKNENNNVTFDDQTPYYYSNNGNETLTTQVVTGATELTADLIGHNVSGAVFYNENTVDADKQESDLTKDLFSTASAVAKGAENVMTTMFTRQSNNGVPHDLIVNFFQEKQVYPGNANKLVGNAGLDAENAGAYYFVVRLYNEGKLVAYTVKEASTAEVAQANNGGTFTTTIGADETFTIVDDNGIDIPNSKTVKYDPTVYTSKVRLYKANEAGTLPTLLSEVDDKGTDTIPGYDFNYNMDWTKDDDLKTVADDEITRTGTRLGLYEAKKKIYQVKVIVEDGSLLSTSDKLDLFVEAIHQTSNVDKYGTDEEKKSILDNATTDSAGVYTIVIEDQTTEPDITQNWTSKGKDTNTLTGNETFKLYVTQNDKKLEDGYPITLASGAAGTNYAVTYDTDTVDEDGIFLDKNVETDGDVTTITHYVYIKPIVYERAIDPYDVLGAGAEYGVIADTYDRHDHSETNFAVNKYIENTNAGIDLAANESDDTEAEGMPFYVGEYNHIKFTGNTTVNPDIYTPATGATQTYVHKSDNSEESTDHIHQDGTGCEVTVIPTSKGAVSSYVGSLISKLKKSSETYATKETMKATNPRAIDTTMFPDGITIYVDASAMKLGEPGWTISKLENQSIVFNIPGETVDIAKEVVSVYRRNTDGTLETVKEDIDANTGGNGGDSEHNSDVENHILNHIVFNAYEASKVNFTNGPAGLFLAPNAIVEEISGSGTGWVATGKTFKQTSAEWHFFRTQRRYRRDGTDIILGAEKLMQVDGSQTLTVPEDGQQFSFKLETLDLTTGAWVDTETVTNDGSTVAFEQIVFDLDDAEGVHYYRITELEPDAPAADITYDTDTQYIVKVTVSADVEGNRYKIDAADGVQVYKLSSPLPETGYSESYNASIHDVRKSNDIDEQILESTTEVERYRIVDSYLDSDDLVQDGLEGIQFINRTGAAETIVRLTATKQFSDWGEAEEFTFKLEQVADEDTEAYPPMPADAVKDVDGHDVAYADAEEDDLQAGGFTKTVTIGKPAAGIEAVARFGEIEYLTAGDYTYKISEVIPDDADEGTIEYDDTEFTVVVHVTADQDTGDLSVTYDMSSKQPDDEEETELYSGETDYTAPVLVNARKEEGKGSLNLKKTLDINGAAATTTTVQYLSKDKYEFTFQVWEEDGETPVTGFTYVNDDGDDVIAESNSVKLTLTKPNGGWTVAALSKTLKLSGLPEGIYVLTETAPTAPVALTGRVQIDADGETESNSDEVLSGTNGIKVEVVAGEDTDVQTAAFTNDAGDGKLSIKKVVTGDVDVGPFTFTVKNTDTNKYYTVTGNADSADLTAAGTAGDAEATVSVGKGYTMTITGLPFGHYEVAETGTYTVEDYVWSTVMDPANGQVTVDDATIATPVVVTMTNAYAREGRNMLKLYKFFEITGDPVDPEMLAALQFKVTTERNGEKFYVTYYGVDEKDGEGNKLAGPHLKYGKLVKYTNDSEIVPFTYAQFDSGMLVIENIPYGTYTITETNASDLIDGYAYVKTTMEVIEKLADPDNGEEKTTINATVGEGDFTQVRIKNYYEQKLGKLDVVKAVTVDGETATDALFTGKTYRVAVYSEEEVTTGEGNDANTETVRTYYATTGRALKATENQWVEIKAGVANKVTWIDLPEGTYYVEELYGEAGVDGYSRTTTVTVGATTTNIVEDGATPVTAAEVVVPVYDAEDATTVKLATVTNAYTRDKGTLKIDKTVFVNNADVTDDNTGKTFYVKVLFTDKQGNAWYMTESSGTLTKMAAETTFENAGIIEVEPVTGKTYSDVPTGTYTVYEVDSTGKLLNAEGAVVTAIGSNTFSYDMSRTEAEAEVEKDQSATAELVNKYTNGQYCIAVTKQWIVDGKVWADDSLTLTVKLQRTTTPDDEESWTDVKNIFLTSEDGQTQTRVNTITLNKANNWSAVAVAQDQMDANGNRYSYRWVELNGDTELTTGDDITIGGKAWIVGDPETVQQNVKDGTTLIFLTKLKNFSEPHKQETEPYEGTGDLGGVKVGDEITYEISYNNYKSDKATITIEDKLDPNVALVSADGGAYPEGAYDADTHTVTWTLTDVPAGAHGTVTLKVKVLEGALVSNEGPGEVVNGGSTATVKVGNDTAKELEVVTNPVEEEPHKKEITPDQGIGELCAVKVGEQITYEIEYTNYKAEAADIVIKDTLDPNVKYVSSGPEGSHSGEDAGGVVTWTLTNVPAGTHGSVKLVVEVLEGAQVSNGGPGKVVNGGENATVKVGNDAEKTLEVVENPVPEVPHKQEILPDQGIGELCAVNVDDEITYEISYRNYKSEPANITIVDTLDDHVAFVEADNGGTHSGEEAGGVVTWTLNEVPAGEEGKVTLVVKVLETAKVSFNNGPGKVVNGGETAWVQVGNDSKYTLEEVSNPVPEQPHKRETNPYEGTGTLGPVNVGDDITYEISYRNYKSVAATVTIEDKLDPNVEFVSASDGGAYSVVDGKKLVNWTLENVAANTEGTVTLKVKVLEGALTANHGPGEVVNGGESAWVQVGNDSKYTLEEVENPVESVSVTVTKAWDDQNDNDGKRPAEVQVQLYADGVPSGDPVKLGAFNNWTYTWQYLRKLTIDEDNSTEITYTVAEAGAVEKTDDATGDKILEISFNGAVYTVTVSDDTDNSANFAYTVTNSHTPAVTLAKVVKAWDDNDNQDGKRPTTVTMKLYANNVDTGIAVVLAGKEAPADNADTVPATGNYSDVTIEKADDALSAIVKNLPAYIDGVEQTYTWLEDQTHLATAGYTIKSIAVGQDDVTEDGYVAGDSATITNTYTPGKFCLAVLKAWDDQGNRYNTRPTSITVELYKRKGADGDLEQVTGLRTDASTDATVDQITLNAANNWTAMVLGVDKYEDGVALQYFWKEVGAPAGYTLANAAATTETIDEVTYIKANQAGTRVGSIVNALDTGKLTITKTFEFVPQLGATPDLSHLKFTVTGYADDRKAKTVYGPTELYLIQFSNTSGTYSYELDKLPLGYYEVVEETTGVVIANYTLTGINGKDPEDEGANVVIATLTKAGANAEFENKYEIDKGNLILKKEISNPQALLTGEADTEFTFTVTLSDQSISGAFKTFVNGTEITNDADKVSFTGGVATVTLKKDGVVRIEGLPAGITYTVEETQAANFEAPVYTYGDTAKKIEKDDNDEVTVTNTRKTGDLQVAKEVVSSLAGDKAQTFDVTVTLTPAITGTFGGMEFTDGKTAFTITDSQTVTITGLPTGVHYTVAEANAEGFVATYSGETGDVSEVAAIARITNTKQEGSLSVTKRVDSLINADKEKDFAFTVTFNKALTLPAENITVAPVGTATYSITNSTSLSFTLKDGQTLTMTGIPAGYTYTVTETQEEGFEAPVITYSDDADKKIDHGDADTVTVDNTRTVGDLTINKSVVSPAPADETKEFTFTVRLSAGDQLLSGKYTVTAYDKDDDLKSSELTVFSEGEAEIPVYGGGHTVIEGVPVGASYRVAEVVDSLFTVAPTEANGTMEASGKATEFTNTRKTGNLKVTKKVINGNEDDVFTFKVELTANGGAPYTDLIGLDTEAGATFGGMTFKTVDGKTVATFPLQEGGEVIATGLPVGVFYEVSEETSEGYVPSFSGRVGEIIEGTSTAAYTNTKAQGKSLIISKSVVSSVASDKTKPFHFTLTLYVEEDGDVLSSAGDATVTSSNGTTTLVLTEGKYEFDLKDGEVLIVSNIPEDAYYEVEEADAAGFEVSPAKKQTGVISESSALAAFTNTKKSGKLKLVKNVISPIAADKNRAFEFVVKLYNEKTEENEGETVTTKEYLSGTFGGRYFDGANGAKFYVKDGTPLTLDGIPDGTCYEVTETPDASFAQVSEQTSGLTGTIDASATEATIPTAQITNQRNGETLVLKKSVVSSIAADKTKPFTFTLLFNEAITDVFPVEITGSVAGDDIIDATEGEGKLLSVENGVATVTLTDGAVLSVRGLPVGVTCTVVEALDNLFVTTPALQQSVVITTDPVPTEFTNTRKTGSLEITKTVNSNNEADKTKDFSFTVTFDKALQSTAENKLITFAKTGEDPSYKINGTSYSFTLKDGEKLTISGIPTGVTYTVAEETETGFVTTKTGESGTICLAPAKAAFTNTRQNGGLIVSKRVVSDVAGDKTAKYSMKVTLNVDTVTGTFGQMSFTNGEASFELTDGETKSAVGLPNGIGYTVEETLTDAQGQVMTATYSGETGTISQTAVASAVVTNTRNTGKLTISKTVENGLPTDESRAFTFNVELKLNGTGLNGTYGGVTFASGEATVTVAAGSSLTLTGIPYGATWKVTEPTVANFTTKVGTVTTNVASGTIDALTPEVTAAFTNTRDKGDLTITKTVESPIDADKSGTYTFDIYLDADFDGEAKVGEEKVQFTNGVGRVTITTTPAADGSAKGTGSKTITGLPAGVDYTVVETAVNGMTTTSTGNTGKITKTTVAEAKFTNTRDTGSLVIDKSVFVDGADATDDHTDKTFYLKLKGVIGGVTYWVTNANGALSRTDTDAKVFTVKPGSAGKVTIANLPVGEYTATEVNKDGNALAATDNAIGNMTYLLTLSRTEDSASVAKAGTATASLLNAYTTGKYSLAVTKQWLVNGAAYVDDSLSLKVKLQRKLSTEADTAYADVTGYANITLNNTNNWSYVAVDLPDMDENGVAYEYQWVESDVPAGWVAGIPQKVQQQNGTAVVYLTKLINSKASADLQVTKVFDTDGTAARWPEEGFSFTLAKGTFTPEAGTTFTGTATATATKVAPVAKFDTIEFTKEGTYTFTVTETVPTGAVDGVKDGISYDTESHTVTVTVAADETTGALVATVSYDDPATTDVTETELTVTNTYTTANATATLQVTKALDGRDWLVDGDSFEFTLAKGSFDPADGAGFTGPETARATKANKTASFGEITFAKAGTYSFSITEQLPEGVTEADLVNGKYNGIAYDTAAKNVTVTVTDDGKGSLVEDVKYGAADSLTVTNTYTTTDATAGLQVTKALTNGDGKWPTDGFEFTLAQIVSQEGVTMPTPATATATEANKTATFGNITFAKPGTYYFTIAETVPTDAVDGMKDGIAYDGSKHIVVVTVTDNNEGALIATVKYDGQDSLTVTNVYTAGGTVAQLEVTKELTGSDNWPGTGFVFDLAFKDGKLTGSEDTITDPEVAGVTRPAITTVATAQLLQTAKFGLIAFTKAGEYEFTITERAPSDAEAVDGEEYKKVKDGITYDIAPKTVKVKVTEASGKLTATVDYDAATPVVETGLTVANTYTTADATATLEVTKALEGRSWRDGDSFTFTLAQVGGTDDDGVTMPEEDKLTATATKAGRTATFGEITFAKTGTYRFTITEQLPENVSTDDLDEDGRYNGITYDTASKAVTVTVTDDGVGSLVADVKYGEADSLTVTNTYTTTPVELALEVAKELSGREWTNDDEFTFTLQKLGQQNGVTMPDADGLAVTIDKDTADYKAVFGKITFTEPGDYTFTIAETVPDDAVNGVKDGITYDASTHIVVVSVVDNDGTLSATPKYDGQNSLTVTNVYAVGGTTVQLEVTKALTDGDGKWPGTGFVFELKTVEGADYTDVTMPALTTVATAEQLKTAKFGLIAFAQAGEYEFTITEKAPDDAETIAVGDKTYKLKDGITYDVEPKTVKVKVENVDDQLVATVDYDATTEAVDSSLTVTNTYDFGTVEASVEKIWSDGDDQDGLRPETLSVTLYANDDPVSDDETDGDLTRELSASNGWKATVTGLPKVDAQNKAIEYHWVETDVPEGYALTTETTVSRDADGKTIGFITTLTNTHAPETTKAKVVKVWADDDDAEGARPTELYVTLKKTVGGTTSDVQIVKLDADNEWTATVEDLPANEGGEAISYSWTEDNVPEGYLLTASDPEDLTEGEGDEAKVVGTITTLTNTFDTNITKATVVKVWDDDNNALKKRPESLTVTLWANDAPYVRPGETEAVTVTLDRLNAWTATVQGLLKADADGEAITYSWKEGEMPEGYELTASDSEPLTEGDEAKVVGTITTLTNSYVTEKTKATVVKKWVDGNDIAELRPAELYVTLNRTVGETTSAVKIVKLTPNDKGEWTWTEENLPKYEDDVEIAYSWTEESVPEGYTLTPSDPVEEKDGSGAVIGTVTTLTNAILTTSTTVSASVKKVWVDDEDRDGVRPENLTVTLLANGDPYERDGKPVTVTLNAKNDWTDEVKDLPELDVKRQPIKYTWEEEKPPEGYKLTDTRVDGELTTLTNTYAPKTTQATVVKVWDDDENAAGARPTELYVTLKKTVGDTTSDVQIVKLDDAKNKWTATVEDLPAKEGGETVTYSWTEESVPEGYELTDTRVDGIVTTLTNTYVTEEETQAKVVKVWNDNDDAAGLRPTELYVTLKKTVGETTSDVKIVKLTPNDKGEWTWTEANLPKFEGDAEVKYSWAEESVPEGYTLTTAIDETGTVTTLTNTYNAPDLTQATVVKVWEDNNNEYGLRPQFLEVRLLANTLPTDITVILSDANKWTATVENLAKLDADGKPIVYDWDEGEVAPYTAAKTVDEETGATVLTNTYVVTYGSYEAVKNWTGGTPGEAKLTLIGWIRDAEGNEVAYSTDTKTVSGNATAKWENVPKYTAEGQPIIYTLKEEGVGKDGKIGDYISTITGDAQSGWVVTNHYTVTPPPTPADTPTPAPVVTPTPTPTPTPTSTTTTTTGGGGGGNGPAATPTPTPVPLRDINGTKVWVDENNGHFTRPDSITVTLYADGVAVSSSPTWSNTNGNNWHYTFSDLPTVNESGETINYTVRETPVENYTATVRGFTITNRLDEKQPEKYVMLSGVKTWDDNDNARGIRPNSITVRLYRDGVEVDKRNVSAATNWQYTFDSLPADDGYGNVYTYELREDGVKGYFSQINGMNVTNKLLDYNTPDTPETVEGNVTDSVIAAKNVRNEVPTRKTGTRRPKYDGMTEGELEELFDLFGYGTPLWGDLLPTGDETPAWPFVFGGIGIALLGVVLFISKRRRYN